MSNDFNEATAETGNFIKCKDCGANLKYLPGTPYLNCEYCGVKNEIESNKELEIIENDYETFLSDKASKEVKQEISTVKCSNCAASTTLPPNVTSSNCPYCDTPLVIKDASTSTIIKPSYLLPFKINNKEATQIFESWVSGLWFAPSKLKQYAQQSSEKLKGMYMPYWTYDTNTISNYAGMRGDHYYITETYTDSQGKTQTRQVRRTRWSSASGTVYNEFDDVLIIASRSLPESLVNDLEPWDLKDLAAYNDKFLSGFITESYQTDLKTGFDKAKLKMRPVIESRVRQDIGGDEQQINSLNSEYNDITFKHILLPLWISSYKYNDKVYRFLINARTGEAQGERPYSAIKIVLFIATILLMSGAVFYFLVKN
ncbi:MAG: hypothetical protein IT237_01635 [Bacteroidia bacterium]|nr:hypothetical protein [Bacteroidia bacterium]